MKRSVFIITLFTMVLSVQTYGQDLLNARLRKITARKTSIFFDRGIFYHGGPKKASSLKAVRHSHVPRRGYERIVFDFETKAIPRIYGYVSSDNKTLYLDLFETNIARAMNSFGESKFVREINFFPLSRDSLSVEVHFKNNVSIDIFHLESPGRFVVDIKS
jgi:hypothetical protein